MRILNEHSHWWKKEEKEWACQDKTGNWWIFRNEKKMETKPNKRQKERSARFSAKDCAIIALCTALGISIALNIVRLIQ